VRQAIDNETQCLTANVSVHSFYSLDHARNANTKGRYGRAVPRDLRGRADSSTGPARLFSRVSSGFCVWLPWLIVCTV